MKLNLKGKNAYDYIIIITFILLVFGGIGGGFQPVRIFSIVVFFTFCLRNIGVLFVRGRHTNIVLFFLALTFFSTLSLLWTVSITEGTKALFYFFAHLCVFFNIIISAEKSINPIRSIFLGWYIFIWLTIPIALFEIIFDQHLSISFHGEGSVSYSAGGIAFLRRFSSVTFGNYNTYTMVLIFGLPFLFGNLSLSNKKITMLILIITVIIIIVVNASRGGIISAVLIVIMFLLLKRKNGVKINNFIKVFFIVMFFIAVSYLPTLFEQIAFRLQNRSILEDNTREQLFFAAYEISKDYDFMGAGIGSIEKLMESKGAKINVPHNLLLEILSQYGILFLMPVLFFFLKIFFYARSTKSRVEKSVLLMALVSMPFLFIINSGYLYYPTLWVYFASLYILKCNYRRISYD